MSNSEKPPLIVTCIKLMGHGAIIVGKEYQVVEEGRNYYRIRNSNHELFDYEKNLFTIKKDSIPPETSPDPIPPKFVICKPNEACQGLTVGKMYQVVSWNGYTRLTCVIDDSNQRGSYAVARFTICEEPPMPVTDSKPEPVTAKQVVVATITNVATGITKDKEYEIISNNPSNILITNDHNLTFWMSKDFFTIKDFSPGEVMQLTNCPFCEGAAVLSTQTIDTPEPSIRYQVVCSECKSQTKRFPEKGKAISLWNQRGKVVKLEPEVEAKTAAHTKLQEEIRKIYIVISTEHDLLNEDAQEVFSNDDITHLFLTRDIEEAHREAEIFANLDEDLQSYIFKIAAFTTKEILLPQLNFDKEQCFVIFDTDNDFSNLKQHKSDLLDICIYIEDSIKDAIGNANSAHSKKFVYITTIKSTYKREKTAPKRIDLV